MNGAYTRSLDPSGSVPQNKWHLLNQLMRQRRLAVLALQETHYSVQQAEELNTLFAGLLRVFVSPDPDSPGAARGIAFAVNLRVVRDELVSFKEYVPGRAAALTLTRRRGSRVRMLNVYAPNDMNANMLFWDNLRVRRSSRDLCAQDVLLGDFNVVTNSVDRAPARQDHEGAAAALAAFVAALGVVDGWRARHGAARAFSYLQKSTGSQSRLDRIYVSPHVLGMSHSWDIGPSGVPSDHCLVSVALADYNSPISGPGRWRLPDLLLTDKKFLDDAQQLGHAAVAKVFAGESGRFAAQLRLAGYKSDVMAMARRRAKQLTPKIDR
ncbi:Endonuclease/exonuclease/phosphatase, partial [Cerioporus squamosus]